MENSAASARGASGLHCDRTPTWVHVLAILTVVAAVPLFFLGADVTTKQVGMADQRSFVWFWQALVELFRGGQSHGWMIEHLHRQAGWLIGLCGILLAISLWWKEPRRWVCWLGTVTLGLIVVQGLLGIFRVQLDTMLGPNLAWVHGSFAPLVLATLTWLAVVTSPYWRRGVIDSLGESSSAREGKALRALRRFAWVTCGVIYLQLVLGGMVRHRDFFLGARLHVLIAFAVAVHVILLGQRLKAAGEMRGAAAWFSRLLLILFLVQVFLGIEAWLSRFYQPESPWNQVQPLAARELLRTLHFVAGSFLLAICTALTALLSRPLSQPLPEPTRAPLREEVLV